MDINREVNSVQNLLKASIICAAISLVIGGVFLSAVAIICAIVGWVKLSKAQAESGYSNLVSAELNSQLNRLKIVSVIAGSVALGLNAYTLYQNWPLIMQVAQSGSLDALYGQYSAGSNTASNLTDNLSSSTWG